MTTFAIYTPVRTDIISPNGAITGPLFSDTLFTQRVVVKSGSKTPKPWPKRLKPRGYTWEYSKYWANPNCQFWKKDSYGWSNRKFGSPSAISSGSWGVLALSKPAPPVGEVEANSNAIVDALTKLKDQKFNLAQAFAEREQMIRLVGDSARQLALALMSLKKGNFRGARQLLKNPRLARLPPASKSLDAVSQQWLSLQYGWRPLIADVYNACEVGSLFDLANPQGYVCRVEGTYSQQKNALTRSIVKRDSYESDNNQGLLRWDQVNQKSGAKVGLWYFCNNQVLASQNAFGLLNPLSIAWELLPFSFVADWFIPIGGYISSFGATLGLNFLDGYGVYYHKFESKRLWTTDKPMKTYGIEKLSGYNEEVKGNEGHRQIYADFPVARRPYFKNPFSTTHALNALALLQSAGKVK